VFGSLPVPVFLLSAAVAAWALALIRLINYVRRLRVFRFGETRRSVIIADGRVD
jgi:hypothetical protein